jgi:molybdopterin-guanine dinucleotide biosynthesis protein A
VSRVSIVLREGAAVPIDLPEVHDRYAARAPIVGLHAALAAAEAPAVLVAACDLPDIQPSLLLGLLSLVPTGAGPEAIVPVGPHGPEPLLAVYRTEIIPELERRIESGDLALQRLVESVRAVHVPERALRALDPDLRSLRNLNRPDDLRARRAGE